MIRCWGRRGATGRSQVSFYPDQASVQREFQRVLRLRLRTGIHTRTHVTWRNPSGDKARNHEGEATLLIGATAPSDGETFLSPTAYLLVAQPLHPNAEAMLVTKEATMCDQRTSPLRALVVVVSLGLLALLLGACGSKAVPAAETPFTAVASPPHATVTRLGASTAAADLRGIYVYTPLGAQDSTPATQSIKSALNLPGVDGMLLVGLWSAIEPAIGTYDWSNLDNWMSFATSSGKKVDLVIRAGDGTPSWLFQPAPDGAGATPLSFTITPHEGKTDHCDAETIAAPWDPVFLSQWDALLNAMSTHLQSTGAYGALTLLRLTGINRTSDELRLPEETAQSTGLSCVSDSVSTWQQAEYRPSKLLQAWDAVTSSFQKSFPDKSFSVAIIPNPPQIAFPTIAEDGSVIPGNPPEQNVPLLQLASQKFPGRLAVQFNFLLPGTPANPEVIQAAQTLGTLVAFQTNNFYSLSQQGAACGGIPERPTPCTAASFLTLLQTGIYPLGRDNTLRSQYIEVWDTNANAFPDDVQQAHNELLAQP